MMRYRLAAAMLSAALLGACGSGGPSRSAQQVIDEFKAAGLAAEDVKDGGARGGIVPQVFKDNLSFTIPSLNNGKGGQIFTCASKADCDQLMTYYTKLKTLAGRNLFRSKDGTVVAQLNSTLTPDLAAKYQAVVEK